MKNNIEKYKIFLTINIIALFLTRISLISSSSTPLRNTELELYKIEFFTKNFDQNLTEKLTQEDIDLLSNPNILTPEDINLLTSPYLEAELEKSQKYTDTMQKMLEKFNIEKIYPIDKDQFLYLLREGPSLFFNKNNFKMYNYSMKEFIFYLKVFERLSLYENKPSIQDHLTESNLSKLNISKVKEELLEAKSYKDSVFILNHIKNRCAKEGIIAL